MGIVYSFFGRHDFLTYEKSLEKITQESNKLLVRRGKRRATLNRYKSQLRNAFIITIVPCIAWVAYQRQYQQGNHSITEYFFRTAAPFSLPALAYFLGAIIQRLLLITEKREDKQLKKFDDAKKKLIKELKDTTNFEKTMALLKKYDPEVHKQVVVASTQVAKQRAAKPNQQAPASGTLAKSNMLLSALDSVGLFATKVLGDNPTLLEELRKAHAAAMSLKQENDMLRQHLEQLCNKHDEPTPWVAMGRPLLADAAGTTGTSASNTAQQPTSTSQSGFESVKGMEQEAQAHGGDATAAVTKVANGAGKDTEKATAGSDLGDGSGSGATGEAAEVLRSPWRQFMLVG